MYFGGGTPSVMRRGILSETAELLRSSFDLSELKEFTVEANPDSVTDGFLNECVKAGVDRISMGLQSADDNVLKAIGRAHDVNRFIEAVKSARAYGINNLSSDLILGLPEQTEEDIPKAISLFDGLNIDHVSVYALSVEEGTRLYKSGYKPDEDRQADMYELAVSELGKYGYERYEVSNFARNGKIALHNYKYWTGADYYGFGVAAHSLIGKTRLANTDSLTEYLSGKATETATELTEADEKEEFIMLRLRLSEGLSLNEYREKFGESLLDEKKRQLEKLVKAGAVDIKNGRIIATDKGTYLLNSVITELI